MNELIDTDDQAEHEHSWLITSRIAALPPFSPPIACPRFASLIKEARELNLLMAAQPFARACESML